MVRLEWLAGAWENISENFGQALLATGDCTSLHDGQMVCTYEVYHDVYMYLCVWVYIVYRVQYLYIYVCIY